MKRFLRVGLGAVLLTLVVPAVGSAQVYAYVSGGASLPMGDYGDLAQTGWMAQGGLLLRVGEGGFGLGAGGFYGSNSHEADGDKTNLYGAMGFAQYTVQSGGGVAPYFFVGPAYMSRAYKSEANPNLEGTESGLALAAGAGITFPLKSVALYGEAMFLKGVSDKIEQTSVLVVSAGISIPLGGY